MFTSRPPAEDLRACLLFSNPDWEKVFLPSPQAFITRAVDEKPPHNALLYWLGTRPITVERDTAFQSPRLLALSAEGPWQNEANVEDLLRLCRFVRYARPWANRPSSTTLTLGLPYQESHAQALQTALATLRDLYQENNLPTTEPTPPAHAGRLLEKLHPPQPQPTEDAASLPHFIHSRLGNRVTA